ncbi:MAG: ABC transporter ATP-binding protein [Lachnospiraceae bacterium]|nr:ABC transporter ATP-binding protein [Lachnospiraceae bacterium]
MSRDIPFFEMDKLCVGYDGKAVVKDISLSIKKAGILTIIGPNGTGKSTIIKTLTRMIPAVSGSAKMEGEDILSMNMAELSQKLAVVYTVRPGSDMMSCYEMVSTGRHPYTGFFGSLSGEDESKIRESMELMGVADLADRPFTNISDGQRQRIMLSRAICQEPSLLVMDEPVSFLDIKHKLEFLSLLDMLRKQRGITVIMSLHELELVKEISDKILCIKDGRCDRVGSPEEIFDGEYVAKLFDIDMKDISTRKILDSVL